MAAKRSGKEYKAWLRMILRCHDKEDSRYPWYGARGIKVCQRWRDSFDAFLDDVGHAPTAAHTIDRFPDNDGNYEPKNVRWATWEEQAQNRRSNRLITINGLTLTMAGWAKRLGCDRRVIHKRLTAGWSHDKACTTPAAPRRKGVLEAARRAA